MSAFRRVVQVVEYADGESDVPETSERGHGRVEAHRYRRPGDLSMPAR